VFTRIRKVTVSWQGLYTICCRSFYVKQACIVYWTLFDTTNWFYGCFWFSANDPSIEQIYPSLLQKSFVSGIVKKRALNQNKNANMTAYRNAGNCPYS